MKNDIADKVLGVSSTIVFIETLLIVAGLFVTGKDIVLGVALIIQGIFIISLICPLITGYAELIEKTSSIEELLKFTALQEDTINKNVYTISHNLYTKNNYNDEFKTQLKVNQEILNTLKSIEEKLDKPNKQKKKNTK